MTVAVTPMTRRFVFNGATLADPGAHLSLNEVRRMHAMLRPDLVSAELTGPENKNGVLVYTYAKSVHTKG